MEGHLLPWNMRLDLTSVKYFSAFSLGTWEAETGGSQTQASLFYRVRPCLKSDEDGYVHSSCAWKEVTYAMCTGDLNPCAASTVPVTFEPSSQPALPPSLGSLRTVHLFSLWLNLLTVASLPEGSMGQRSQATVLMEASLCYFRSCLHSYLN